MKKYDTKNQILKTTDRAENYGYRIKEVVLKYATSWWVWVPGVKHFGAFKSEERALQICDTHLKRSLGR